MSGRTKTKEASTNVTFSITDKTIAKLSMLVHDPVTGRAKYGMKSHVAEELFARFFDAVVKGEDTINVRDLRAEVQP